MGYYTYHTLDVKNVRPEEEETLIQEMDSLGITGYALEGTPFHYDDNCVEFSGSDSCKWYEHEEDMIKLSKKFPHMVFKLHGEGEEQGDLWDNYYQNGRSETCRAEIYYPEPKQIPWN